MKRCEKVYQNEKLKKLKRKHRKSIETHNLYSNMIFDAPRIYIEKIKKAWGE